MKDVEGKLLTNDDDNIRKRWSDHFVEVLNRPVLTDEANITQETPTIEEIERRSERLLETRIVETKGSRNGLHHCRDAKRRCGNDHKCATRVIPKNLGSTEDARCYKSWNVTYNTRPPISGPDLPYQAPTNHIRPRSYWNNTFMSTAANVMGRVIIKIILEGIDQQLRTEKAGCKSGRSTTYLYCAT